MRKPKTNQEIRKWYLAELAKLPKLNKEWIKAGLKLRQRAYSAWSFRHDKRVEARSFMRDPLEVEMLEARDKEKYDKSDGPTFGFLLRKLEGEGLRVEEAYEAIIEGSYRTDEGINKSLGF